MDGSRDMFAARDADSKAKAAQALDRWKGTYSVAWQDGEADGWNTLSVAVKTKGRVTVKGALADGTQVTASTQLLVGGRWLLVSTGTKLLVGERECAVAVSWARRKVSVACLLWFGEDGTVTCENLLGGATALAAPVGAGLAADAEFRIDPAAVAAAVPGLRMDLSFPGGIPAKLTLRKKKDGTFSGSFRVYVDGARRVKSIGVSVSGVTLDGKGYGTAVMRRPAASWPVTIE